MFYLSLNFGVGFNEMAQKMPSFENSLLSSNDFPSFFANSAKTNAYNFSSEEVSYALLVTKEPIWISNHFKFQIVN